MVLDLPRPLPFPLYYQAGMVVETPEGETACGLPEFPEDSDEKITVLFRLSLNEFVKIASAVDIGSDIGYGADGLKIWWLWVANIMCASFCEEMAECINDPESAFTLALADQLKNNPALAGAIADAMAKTGAAVPGRSLTPGQAATSILPPEVKDEFGDCIPDALWGACLYLVQSGNRAITDFFEILESASNTLEASGIIASAIPAAGQYAGAAAEFADQMAENIAEGYSAAYTEDYEIDLACDIFCAAMENCELTPDMLIDILNARMPELIDVATFGLLMAQIGTIIIPPEAIADTAFLVFFTALKFGQQFGEMVGIRPLEQLMGLGADQLASDNWETLCDCAEPEFTVYQYNDYAGGTPIDTAALPFGEHTFSAVQFGTPANRYHLRLEFSPQVKVTVVSTTWVLNTTDMNPFEDWLDRDGSGGFVFFNAPGSGNNSTLPYTTIDDVIEWQVTRLWQQNGQAFNVTLLVEPDV